MAGESINVGENTRGVIERVMTDFRDPEDSTAVKNITGWVIKMTVKRDPIDDDAYAWIDLAATITDAVNGKYKYTLTLAHTSLPVGTWFGEERWWEDGVTTRPPHDRVPFSYTVEKAIDETL